MKEQAKKWGPNDTVLVPAIFYHNEIVNFKEMEMVWVSKLSPEKLAKFIEEWNRLRNAVYVTYPYARIAGATINDINTNLANVKNKKETAVEHHDAVGMRARAGGRVPLRDLTRLRVELADAAAA